MGNDVTKAVSRVAGGDVSRALGIHKSQQGSSVIHHHHTVKKPDPVPEKKLEETEEKIEEVKKEIDESTDPTKLGEQLDKQFSNIVDNIRKLNLTDPIEKKKDEEHIGVIGPVSSGKTTFINTLFKIDLPVALGHCTTECQVVHREGNKIIWDMPGDNDSFKLYEADTLSFIKSLDKCIIMFDSDPTCISWILKIINAINPEAMIIVRTKVDQHDDDHERTVDEEKLMDIEKINKLFEEETSLKTYCISSHNIRDNKDKRFDWKEVVELLN